MTRPIIVIGAGGHSRVVCSILQEEQADWQVIGVLDTGSPRAGERILEVPVIGGMEALAGLRAEGIGTAAVALGDARDRAARIEEARAAGLSLPPVVSRAAYVAPTANIGEGCLICPFAHVGPAATVGVGAIVNTGANLEHESTLGDHSHLAPGSSVAGRAAVGARVFVGMGARIIERCTVADDAVIGANAVVIDDVTVPGSRLLGVPATVR